MKTRDCFFCLVRLGINHPVTILPESIDWESVRNLASDQGLSAIVLDGAQVLSDRGELSGGRAMDVALKKKWIGSVIQNYERKYEDYRKHIEQLARFYNEHGFQLMLLKGYEMSLNYPIPSHRPCGDIDIWLFGKYREADRVLSRELSIPIDSSHHHHTVFTFKGYTVENHYDFFNVHYGHGNDSLEKILKELAIEGSLKTDIDGQTVYFPSANFHALFILRHCISHFASERMTLRQVLDWAFFVEKHRNEINWPWFLGVLDDYNMTNFFQYMNAICVEDLGFDVSVFPSFQLDAVLKERILEDILYPEFAGDPPHIFFRRIIFRYRRWQANAWKQDFCYGDSRFKAFWAGVWGHLLKPGMI